MCDREREEENLKITRKEKIYEMKSRVYEREAAESASCWCGGEGQRS